MALPVSSSISNFLNSPFLSPPPPPTCVRSLLFHHPCSSKLSRFQILASSSSSSSYGQMDSHNNNNNNNEFGRRKFMEFPHVSAPVKNLMVELVSTVESRLGSDLLPCTLPQNVQYYQNQSGTAQASLHIRSGHQSSPIDFILGSWLHCQLPSGGALNIASLSAYLNSSTDAPHFLIELIQSSPSSLILILDLPPRKDIVLHPDYLKTFYEDPQLEGQRQLLAKLPEVAPYFSSSLYIRCVVSPTAILVRIETEAAAAGSGGAQQRMEEIVRDHASPIAKQVLGIWLDRCATGERRDQEVGDDTVSSAAAAAALKLKLKERDDIFKKNTIEIDLGSNLPRLFGPEIAAQVLGAIQEVFSI